MSVTDCACAAWVKHHSSAWPWAWQRKWALCQWRFLYQVINVVKENGKVFVHAQQLRSLGVIITR